MLLLHSRNAVSDWERQASARDFFSENCANSGDCRSWTSNWQLEGAITAALKNVRDREAVQRVVGLLKASPQATRETLAKNLIRVMGRGTKRI